MGMISTEIKIIKDRIAQINIELDKHKKLETELEKLQIEQEELEEIESRIESIKDDLKQLVADLKDKNLHSTASCLKIELPMIF